MSIVSMFNPRESLRHRSCAAHGAAEDGQALVELVLVLPVLLLVVMGILWFGRALNYTQDETRLTNVAARYAAVDQVPPGAGSSLAEWLRSQADTEELKNGTGDVEGPPKVCVKYPDGKAGVGDPVEVRMSATFRWLPLLKVGASSTIAGSATMRIEVPPTNSFYTNAEGCP
jgi:Flp pilus assembly protein TadG